ncbi:MAG: response regulator transcription factor [Nibricoccus sp.]
MTSPQIKPIRISIVEDDEPARRILGNVVRSAPSLALVSDFGESEKAVAALPNDGPDVILMDINLPQMSGVECVRRLKPLMPQTQFLMLTVYDDPEHIFQALAAGATGYLLKSTRREDLIAAIQQIHEGGSPMSSAIARKVVRSFSAPPSVPQDTEQLSAREQQVLDLLAQGFLYKEIADKLSLNVFTVKTYTRRIYEKLHVHSRSQATAKYYQQRG